MLLRSGDQGSRRGIRYGRRSRFTQKRQKRHRGQEGQAFDFSLQRLLLMRLSGLVSDAARSTWTELLEQLWYTFLFQQMETEPLVRYSRPDSIPIIRLPFLDSTVKVRKLDGLPILQFFSQLNEM
jgi:hypothetical protein